MGMKESLSLFKDKGFWYGIAILFVIWTGWVGYGKGKRMKEFLEHPVKEYTDQYREEIRQGNHDYTYFLLNYTLSLYLYDYIEYAEKQINIVIAEDPECCEVWFILGLLYSDMDHYEEAIPCYERYLELNRDNHIWVTKGNDTCSVKRAKEVIEICKKSKS